VLVPAYQAARTIGESLASVLAQTTPPLEVIVCDDGSTDDLDTAIGAYRDRIEVVRKDNGGGASALNAAAARAHGTFVAVCDADDAYLPERLEALGALAAERPDLDVLATDAFFEVDGITTGRFNDANPFPVEKQRRAVLERCFVFAAAVRRTSLLALDGYDEGLPIAYDWDLLVRLVLGGSAVGLLNAPLITYRLHEGSLAADRLAALRDRVAVLEKNAAAAMAQPETDAFLRSLRLHRDRVRIAEAELALWRGSSRARRETLSIAVMRTPRASVRGWAIAATLAPRLGRRLLLRRDRQRSRSLLVPRDRNGSGPRSE
jgi:glycosyltransferase involved in cell wall biosynthesis